MAELAHKILDKKSIINQVAIALLVGGIILISAVLPAEYGIDPLGIGKLTGFSKLYVKDVKTAASGSSQPHKTLLLENVGSGPEVPVPSAVNDPAPATQLEQRADDISVLVPAGKGLEYKVNMLKYGTLRYEWITDSGELYFDFHGEVKGNSNYFDSYTIAYSNNMVGSLVAPFEGPHGWYFKNNSVQDITVKLRLKGQYLLKQ
ncbi:MAG: hypothetical protein JNK20_01060 [Flavipsychrobacter sp.]|nr:hypothetical protein [Flavipsychrobacter sp.]